MANKHKLTSDLCKKIQKGNNYFFYKLHFFLNEWKFLPIFFFVSKFLSILIYIKATKIGPVVLVIIIKYEVICSKIFATTITITLKKKKIVGVRVPVKTTFPVTHARRSTSILNGKSSHARIMN